jgi:hypothetical protein
MMWKSAIAITIIFMSYGISFAQSESSSFLFLLIGSGSRAAAMGEAYTAVAGDAGAPYFNPASAANMQNSEISLMHISYLTDASMEHVSAVTRSGHIRLGLGLYLGQTTDIQRRGLSPSDDPLGTFNDHNFTFAVFWARPFGDRLAIGNTLKWAYQKLDIESASAFAADLGATYTVLPEVDLGVSVRNLGTRPKFVDKAFDLPRELRIGASYAPIEDSRLQGLTISGDFVIPHWGNKSNKFNLGSEYIYQNLLSLRAGYGINYDSRGFSIGGGISYRVYFFDYAYIPSKNDFNDTHRLTLRIRL